MWGVGFFPQTGTMSETERCSHCDTRIHPLDLSDLHRGRKLDCYHCGAELKAQTRGGVATVAAVIIGGAVFLQDLIMPDSGLIGHFGMAALLVLIARVTPPGLVAGAPWVEIKATAAETDAAWRGEARQRIKALRRKNTGDPSDETGP